MSEANKEAFRKMVAVFGGADPSIIDEIVDDNCVDHVAPPGTPPGREGVRATVNMVTSAFADSKTSVDVILAEGDLVAAMVTASGTHTGEFMGMPPTGKSFTMREFHIVRCRDGKVVEHWGLEDSLSMLQQLGIIPEV
jgi:predicted ester cyclase